MTPLEAAARELAQYNTIPEMVETVWPDCVNPARTAISAYLKACAEDASEVARVRAAIKAPGEPDIDTDVAWYESRVHAVLAALEPKE